MAILTYTGLETHPINTAGLNGIINGNWERLEAMFAGLAGAAPATHTIYWNATTKAFEKRSLVAALTDGASIAWDHAASDIATVTLAGNRTIANPTNPRAGTFILKVTQDATGSRTLAFDTNYHFPGGTAPTLSTTANAVDILTFVNFGDGILHCVATLDSKAP